MSAITFDILGYVRRLKDAGVPEPQAEVHVQVLVDALSKSMDSLVTKEYLSQCLDARFAEQELKLERRLNEFESSSERRFSAATHRAANLFASPRVVARSCRLGYTTLILPCRATSGLAAAAFRKDKQALMRMSDSNAARHPSDA